MAKVTPISEHFQHFLGAMKESLWGDLNGQTKLAWQRFFELQSERQRDRYAGGGWYERGRSKRREYRNGYYERDFVTPFGTIRLRIARTRGKSFLPCGLQRFQRRAEEVALLIREAFLRGISTRQVGRVVATLTGEVVSAQTVSKLTRDLDQAVREFHQARLADDYAYLFLDGVSLRVRRPAGRKRVQMLVAYGVRRGGSRHLLAFLRSQGESQADWEALLQDLYRRGLAGKHLALIITDGCPRLGGGDPDCLPSRSASALLGAQNAQPSGEGAQARLPRSEGGSPGHLSGKKPRPGGSGVSRLPHPLAPAIHPRDATLGTRPTGTVLVLHLFPAPVAQPAHHQRDRTLLCRSPAPDSTHCVLCKRRKRGSHHLLHFPEIQSGVENPHPLRIYTSSLTSPGVFSFMQRTPIEWLYLLLRNCEIYLIAGRAAFEGGSWEHGGSVCAGCTTTQVTFEE